MPVIPQPLVPEDNGSADTALASALAAYAEGRADATRVLSALAPARLLVPVVAVLTEAEVGEHGLRRDKESEMALPKLIGQDGRAAIPAFTGTDALTRWRPDARPIQATAPQVCRAALQENAAAVVLDVAGPVSFAVEGSALRALSALDGPPTALADRLSSAGLTVTPLSPAPPSRRARWPFARRTR